MNHNLFSECKWPSGHLFALSALDGLTDYKEGIVARTSSKGIEVRFPDYCRIDLAEPQTGVFFTSDGFSYETLGEPSRGVIVDAYHMLIEGALRVEECAPTLQTLSSGNRLLVGTKSRFKPALIESDIQKLLSDRSEWLKKQNVPKDLSHQSQLSLVLAYLKMKGQLCSPEGLLQSKWTTPDRWPHKDMWLWDSVFHAIGWRHIDPEISKEMINAVFEAQRADGFIPLRAWPYGREEIMTQPPVLALGVKLISEKAKDTKWLEQVYPKLIAYVEWDLANRDTDGGGLSEWFIEEHENCRSGESGLDNSPRFDSALQLDAVDFNSFLALEMEILSEIADSLGKKDEAVDWRSRHKQLCEKIESRLWSKEFGFYCDYNPLTQSHTDVLSCVGFLPLICGATSKEHLESLLGHLDNPQTFGTPFPVPTVAANQKRYFSKDMWRGPVWINLNWLIIYGLKRYGCDQKAEYIRDVTLRGIEKMAMKYGTFFEYFDSLGEDDPPKLLRKGKCDPDTSAYHQVMHDFGWSTTLYTDLLLTKYTRIP